MNQIKKSNSEITLGTSEKKSSFKNNSKCQNFNQEQIVNFKKSMKSNFKVDIKGSQTTITDFND